MTEQGEATGGSQSNNECEICKVEVKHKDKALCCDICLKWLHTDCVKINRGNYTSIKNLSSACKGLKWLCDGCEKFFGQIITNFQDMIGKQTKIEEQCKSFESGINKIVQEFTDFKESIGKRVEELKGTTYKEFAEMKVQVKKLEKDVNNDSTAPGMVEGELGELKEQLGELKIKYSEVLKIGLQESSGTTNLIHTTQSMNIQGEVNEKFEREKRKNNLVIFGIAETGDMEVTKERVKNIINIMEIEQDKVKYFGRVGRNTNGGKTRVVRIVCEDQETKRKILKGANKLRTVEGYDRIYISLDLTKEQQAQDKKLRDKLKDIRVQYKEAKISNGAIVLFEDGNKKVLHPTQN